MFWFLDIVGLPHLVCMAISGIKVLSLSSSFSSRMQLYAGKDLFLKANWLLNFKITHSYTFHLSTEMFFFLFFIGLPVYIQIYFSRPLNYAVSCMNISLKFTYALNYFFWKCWIYFISKVTQLFVAAILKRIHYKFLHLSPTVFKVKKDFIF